MPREKPAPPPTHDSILHAAGERNQRDAQRSDRGRVVVAINLARRDAKKRK